MVYLDKVSETSKDESADTHEEDEKKQLLVAVLESVSNCLIQEN